jgi:hypothetical protein
LARARQDLENITNKNVNLLSSDERDTKSKFNPPKRRMSRQSNRNFSIIDFNYIGDTSKVSHLIKRRIGGSSPT